MKRDNQKSKVYDWEDSLPLKKIGIVNGRRCSFKYCKELISAGCELYGLPEVNVCLPLNPRQTSATYQPYYISLPVNFHRKDVALHEAAHYITSILWPRELHHGKVFVRVYINLLAEILGGNLEFMEYWAECYDIKFSNRKIYYPGQKILSVKELDSLHRKINLS